MLTLGEFRSAAEAVSNWGRWGPDDEIGTLNLIGAEQVAASAALVQRGRVFPLGTPFGAGGIWPAGSFRQNPIHVMTLDGGDSHGFAHLPDRGPVGAAVRESSWGRRLAKFNDDMIIMSTQAASQWDALSHVYYDDLLYNGFPAASVTSAGAVRLGIDRVIGKGIVGRAVVVDLARARGVAHLPPRAAVEPDELDGTLAAQGVSLEPGDILLVRTGWWPRYAATGDGSAWRAEAPGLSWRCARWLHQHDVAAVAADNVAVEVTDPGPSEVAMPLHLLCLRDMGMLFGEMWNLEELAADCAAQGTWTAQLVAPPLEITGAVASPVNPVALR